MDKASGREGVYRSVSIALIVCRETPRAVPSWPWESPRDDRSSLTLFRMCKAYLSPLSGCQACFTGRAGLARRSGTVFTVLVASPVWKGECIPDRPLEGHNPARECGSGGVTSHRHFATPRRNRIHLPRGVTLK